jgi:diketogulonate reductase-like aldo/keto reductase
LPKSISASRIASNANVYDFELDKEDMEAIDGLDEGREGAIDWNPTEVE